MLVRLGGRVWLGALVIAWGLLACCFSAVQNPAQIFALRFLLGAAESGTMPGMWCAVFLNLCIFCLIVDGNG